MRTITAANLAAQVGAVVTPRHSGRIEPAVLRTISNNYTLTVNVRTDIPQTYLKVGTAFIAAYRDSTGIGRIRYTAGALDNTSAQLETAAAAGAMRYGIDASQRVYRAADGSSAWQLKRTTAITSTSNPVSFTEANYGPTFGSGPAASGTLVRRIESITWLQNGQIVVAEGTHRYDTGYSHITFFLISADAATATQLVNAITMPFTETAGAAWHLVAPHAAFITAIAQSSSSTASVMIVANAAEHGRPVSWILKGGVESAPLPVVPTDPEGTSIGVFPCTLSQLNTKIHLTARVVREQVDADTSSQFAYDGYLTAAGFTGLFSFGSKDHWLCNEARLGTMFLWNTVDTPNAIAYVGNGSTAFYTATRSYYTASSSESIESRLSGWRLHQIADGADSLTLELDNADGELTDDTDIVPGSLVYLQSGQERLAPPSELSPGQTAATGMDEIGTYLIDTIQHSVTPGGQSMTITARDKARKTLADWRSPFTGQWPARGKIVTSLDSLAGLSMLTPEDQGYTLTPDGLVLDEYNTPVVALANVADHGGHLLTRATVNFGVADNYHVGALGIVFGTDDTGTGNVLIVPKANNWTSHTWPKPRLRRWALTPIDLDDPDAPHTQWDFEANGTALAEAGDDADERTAAVTATYPTDTAYTVPVGADTDIAFRVFGRFGYVYQKARVMTPAACAQNATWTLNTIVQFDAQAPATRGKYTRVGLALSQDAWFSKTAFQQAEYGDLEMSLTDAGETHAFTTEISDGTTTLEGIGGAGTSYRILNAGSCLPYIIVGQYIKIFYTQDSSTHYVYVTAKGADYFDFSTGINVSWDGLDYAVDVWIQTDGAEWGYASSAAAEMTVDGTNVIDDPGAVLRPRVVGGRGAFISNDNTAMSLRYIASDGVRHALVSGNTTKDLAWDATNPKPGDEIEGGGGSPNGWRMVMHHGRLMETHAADVGLPTTGWMKVNDEIVRYADVTFARRGETGNTEWCVIPTYYVPLAAASAGTTVFTQWDTGGTYPGDDPNTITDAVGLLAEFSSRNTDNESNTSQHYVTAKASHQFTVSPAFPHATRALETIAVLSGRGAFDTTKEQHDPDSAVTYYPCDASGNPATITVSRFCAYSGLYTDTQGALSRACALAGAGIPAYRTMNDPNTSGTSSSLTGATSQSVTIPTVTELSDFNLRLTAYIPKTDTLGIAFRDYYKLEVAQLVNGVLNVRLVTTKDEDHGGIAAYSGSRTLEQVSVPVTYGVDISPTTSTTHVLGVVAIGAELIVELDDQPVWTFDLAHLTDGTNSYLVTTTGPIVITYAGAGMPARSITTRLRELSTEVGEIVVSTDQTALNVIDQIRGDQTFSHRAGQLGTIEFGAWWQRDDAGTLSANLFRDTWRHDDAQTIGHVQVVGNGVTGEASNADVIAAYGYSFDQVSAQWITTLAQAQHEARLVLAAAREFSVQRGVEGRGFLEIQPDDYVALDYRGKSVDCVVTDVELDADAAKVTGTYSLRQYIAP